MKVNKKKKAIIEKSYVFVFLKSFSRQSLKKTEITLLKNNKPKFFLIFLYCQFYGEVLSILPFCIRTVCLLIIKLENNFVLVFMVVCPNFCDKYEYFCLNNSNLLWKQVCCVLKLIFINWVILKHCIEVSKILSKNSFEHDNESKYMWWF